MPEQDIQPKQKNIANFDHVDVRKYFEQTDRIRYRNDSIDVGYEKNDSIKIEILIYFMKNTLMDIH